MVSDWEPSGCKPLTLILYFTSIDEDNVSYPSVEATNRDDGMDAMHSIESPNQPLLDIPAILAVIWQRKMLVVIGLLVGLGLATSYLVATPARYDAQAVVLVDPRGTNATKTPNVVEGIGTDSAAIASQAAIIGSRESLRAVFNTLKLANDPEYAGGSGLLGKLLGGGHANAELAFNKFLGTISVEREGLTYIINVKVSSTNPDRAAKVANTIVERYISGQVAEKSGVSSEVTGLLNDRIVGLRKAVTDAETAVEDFREKHKIYETGSGQPLVGAQIDQTTQQLGSDREALRNAENRYDQAKAIGASADGLNQLTEILSSGSAEALRNSYNERLAELAAAQARFGDRHPTVVSLKAEISHLKSLMRGEAERIIAQLKAERDLARSNAAKTEEALQKLQAKSTETKQLAVQLRQLERNADASRQVLEQFLSRSEETSQLGQLQRPDARLVSIAEPPIQPSWPKRSLIFAVAGIVGAALGAFTGLLMGPVPTDAGASKEQSPPLRPVPTDPDPTDPEPSDPTPTDPGPDRPRRHRVPGLIPSRFDGHEVPAKSETVERAEMDTPSEPTKGQTVLDRQEPAQGIASTGRQDKPASTVAAPQPRLTTLFPALPRPDRHLLTAGMVEAMRNEVRTAPDGAFAQAVADLADRLIAAMAAEAGKGHGPRIVLLGAPADRLEKNLLAHALGRVLLDNGVKVLLVDLDPLLAAGPMARQILDGPHNRPDANDIIDPESGLSVVSAPARETAQATRVRDEALVERLKAQWARAYQIVLIVGRSDRDPARSVAIARSADLRLSVTDGAAIALDDADGPMLGVRVVREAMPAEGYFGPIAKALAGARADGA